MWTLRRSRRRHLGELALIALALSWVCGCSSPCGSGFSGSCKPLDGDGLCYDRRYDDELLSAGHTGVLAWLITGLSNRPSEPDTGLDASCLHVRVLECGTVTAFARQVDPDPGGAVVMAFDPEGRVIGELFRSESYGECRHVAVGQEEAAACMMEARTLLADSAHLCDEATCDQDFCAQLE